MKIQPINNFFKITPQVKQQVKDALYVYKNLGLPVLSFATADVLKDKYLNQFDFYDKINV